MSHCQAKRSLHAHLPFPRIDIESSAVPEYMDVSRSHVTQRLLNLTQEIICLLTGEVYGPIKKETIEWPPRFLVLGENKKNNIVEVFQKIIDLLTGEVPIRLEDITVYFSMEEWKYFEGHKDLYKDIMMENRPPHTSLDGSSNRNALERCSRSLNFRETKPEHHEIPQDDHKVLQDYTGNGLIAIKVEVKEEEEDPYVRDDEPCKDEETPPEISTGIDTDIQRSLIEENRSRKRVRRRSLGMPRREPFSKEELTEMVRFLDDQGYDDVAPPNLYQKKGRIMTNLSNRLYEIYGTLRSKREIQKRYSDLKVREQKTLEKIRRRLERLAEFENDNEEDNGPGQENIIEFTDCDINNPQEPSPTDHSPPQIEEKEEKFFQIIEEESHDEAEGSHSELCPFHCNEKYNHLLIRLDAMERSVNDLKQLMQDIKTTLVNAKCSGNSQP